MLYDLELERRARAGSVRGRADIEELIALGAAHPDHLREVLLRHLDEGAAPTLEDRGWFLARLEEHGGAPLRAYEDYLVEALRVRAPAALAGIRPGLRAGLGPPEGPAFGDHLTRILEVARGALKVGDSYLFHALTRYAVRGLARAGPRARAPLVEAWGFYPAVRALARLPKWRRWLPPLLRNLSLAAATPAARHALAGEPRLLDAYLEPLLVELGDRVVGGDVPRAEALAAHLGSLARALPGCRRVREMGAQLPRLVGLATGGLEGRRARHLRDCLGPAFAPDAAPAAPWPGLRARLEGWTREAALRRRVRAAIRPRPRDHLARFLRLAEVHGGGEPALAALYAESPHLDRPLIAVYFPRGAQETIRRYARGPLGVHLKKSREAYRLSLFHQNRAEFIPCHGFLDEAASFAFRRALTYSGGRYAVAMVEMETLEIGSIRMLEGYLDFTGSLQRGIDAQVHHDPDTAIREFERAAAANPRLAGPHRFLGRCYRQIARSPRDLARARRSYRRELARNPRCADTFNHLGLLELAEGDLGAAAASFDRAIDADPDHLGALANRAVLCAAAAASPGTKARFGRLIKRIHDLDPESSALRRVLGEEGGAFGVDWDAELRTSLD